MKKLLVGGFLFIGGCINSAIGVCGIADSTVSYYGVLPLIYIGVIFIIVGILFGILGLREKG